MARKFLAVFVTLAVSLILVNGCKKETPQKAAEPQSSPATAQSPQTEATAGESLFQKNCAVCHPAGGNSIKPDVTLHGKALKAHNITTAADIVKIMRNPNPGMTKFDETMIPDREATEIAEYVLKNF